MPTQREQLGSKKTVFPNQRLQIFERGAFREPATKESTILCGENELTDRLHDLHIQTDGALQLSETAGILQIFKNSRKYDPKKLLFAWAST